MSATWEVPSSWSNPSSTCARPVAAGIKPINWIPSSLRSISMEKRSGKSPVESATSIASIKRSGATWPPAIDKAVNRVASSGAVPESVTSRPSASISTNCIGWAVKAPFSSATERFSTKLAATLAAPTHSTAATATAIALMIRGRDAVTIERSPVGVAEQLGLLSRPGLHRVQSDQCRNAKKQHSDQACVAVGAKQVHANFWVVYIKAAELPDHVPAHRPCST